MKSHYITLLYDEGKTDGPWFMSTKTNESPKPKKDYEVLYVHKGEKATFNFKIVTEGIEFDQINPIEIAPVVPKTGNTTQFESKANKNHLVVENANKDQDETDYYYKLNFIGKPPLDPIIQNGCCKPLTVPAGNMSLVSETSPIAALLLAAVVIVLMSIRLRRARS